MARRKRLLLPKYSVRIGGDFSTRDSVRALEVHELIAQAGEGARVEIVAAAAQVLPQEVKDGGEGAEVIVLLDMKL